MFFLFNIDSQTISLEFISNDIMAVCREYLTFTVCYKGLIEFKGNNVFKIIREKFNIYFSIHFNFSAIYSETIR